MSAIVSFRSNATGALSPTPAQRAQTAQQASASALTREMALYRLKTGLAAEAGAAADGFAAKAATASATTSAVSSTTTRAVTSDLDKDTFLELLVLELQHQDPLEPVDNGDMLAQLAQFSSLEQMDQLNESFELFSGNLNQLNFISAGTLLGRSIAGLDANGKEVTGVVEGIFMEGDMVYLRVGEDIVPMAYVQTVEETTAQPDEQTVEEIVEQIVEQTDEQTVEQPV